MHLEFGVAIFSAVACSLILCVKLTCGCVHNLARTCSFLHNPVAKTNATSTWLTWKAADYTIIKFVFEKEIAILLNELKTCKSSERHIVRWWYSYFTGRLIVQDNAEQARVCGLGHRQVKYKMNTIKPAQKTSQAHARLKWNVKNERWMSGQKLGSTSPGPAASQ